MADRYWVGGTGNWDTTTTTKWSASSGGSGGASVPTVADNVFFDQAGTYTVNLTGALTCLDITVSAGTVTLANGTSPTLNVAGSMSLVAGTVWSTTANVTFSSTTTGRVVTTNGVLVQSGNFIFNGIGGGWTLGSSLTLNNGNLQVLAGSFSTSATGYAITLSGQLILSSSSVRSVNLNSSTVVIGSNSGGALAINTATNLTFNAGTSQINFTGGIAGITIGSGGFTFYNVSFTNTSASNTRIINGTNTFNNLTLAGPSSTGLNTYSFGAGQTINGVLSTTGTTGNRRVWLRSDTIGIAQTFTINGTPSLTDADFRDIYVIGTAAPISGTRIGDLRGCSGITFSTPKTVYWNLAGAQNWSANGWSDTSTGTPNTDFFPLAQDTATFTNAGSVTGTISFDAAIPYTGTVDISGRTTAMTLGGSTAYSFYGDWKSGTGLTINYSGIKTFSGRKTQTITNSGVLFAFGFAVDSYGGTVELGDNMNAGTATITVTNGGLDTKNYNLIAGVISSSNSNVRTITLGSSTLTLSGNNGINFSTFTNLTFNAGTSSINLTSSFSTLQFFGGVQFYNVTYTEGTAKVIYLNNTSTFNNLTITSPTVANFTSLYLFANQTINGTLTVAGTTAVRRNFVLSDTFGTTRTLTVNSLSATDCDFRDITIAGAAAGSSPTRAGDCGGNTGITFSSKTVYWNLAGAQNWSATGWCPSSGGTPDINQFPLAQDTAVFDNTGSAGTVTFNTSWNIGTFDASARTSAMNLAWSNNSPVCYGNWTLGTGLTLSSGGGRLLFSKRGTQTLTSNGVTFTTNLGITVSSFNGILQLADALNVYDLNVSTGTFDAVSYNVTLFSASLSGTVRMGSGTWTLTWYGTVWTANGTIYCGTANIVLSDNSTNARTFNGSSKVYNKLTIGGATSTSTTTISGNNTFSELASTKTVAHTIALGAFNHTFGAWTVTGTAGNVVTITGASNCIYIVGARVSGVDYLAFGTSGMDATSLAEFYAGANSTGGTNIILTTAPAAVTRYWRGGTGTWDATTTTNWSATSGGSGGASVPTSVDTVIFDSASNATAYTVTCTATQLRCGPITFAGPASGNVTWIGIAPLAVHGNFTLPATGLTRNYTGTLTFSGSTTGKTITTNGVSLGSPITINGIGCGWTLNSALITTGTLTLNSGSFDTAGYAFSTSIGNSLLSQNDFVRTLSLGSSTITASQYQFRNTNFTFNKGTSTVVSYNSGNTIIIYNTSANDLGSLEFYNITLSSNATSRSLVINGNITANTVTVAAVIGASAGTLSFNGNQTYNTLTLQAPANATCRTSLISSVLGTTRTLTLGAFTATSDYDFRDIAVTGAAAPISGTRFGDLKGNSGITFDAAKTVYWNLAGGGNWYDTAWALSSGGSPAVNNFPLTQDTAVIENTGLTAGNQVTINVSWNIGTINMSTRTNAMNLALILASPSIYGNWTGGTGVTYNSIGGPNLTFAGRTNQTFTSAGKTITFPLFVNSIAGSLILQDAFLCTAANNAITLTSGTFNSNGYSVSLPSSGYFLSSNSNVRTVAFGLGSTWTLSGQNGWTTSTSTNLTITGTGTVSLTFGPSNAFFQGGSISYSGITLNQGGSGILSISGNNTFYDITNTYSATGATTISLANTTQRLTQFTASGAAGKVLSITGSSSFSPGTLIITGAAKPTVDYLSISNVRAYPLTDTWSAGSNSVNNGSLGWTFASSSAPATGKFLLLFG
jgi:hypothetical protein